MYLAKINEPLSSTIPTITTTHTPPFIHTLLPSIFYPTLKTAKHEMDLLPKDFTPQSSQFWRITHYFKTPTPSIHPLSQNGTQIYQTPLTLQCGMTSATRHSENIPCSGVTSSARHGACSHSFVYISTTSGANVIGLLRTCS